ncbi:MAG: bifunctional glutamate N-acetyltransferase/amino-acid acetyltransferase ArgJ [bacterium]
MTLKNIKGGITAPKAFKASGMHCGVKKSGKKDLALICSDVPANAAAVFTSNKVKAAPILVSMEHIKSGKAQAIIANSGCANACTGEDGIEDARVMAKAAASALNIHSDSVLVASTGTIGSRLPLKNILNGIRVISKRMTHGGGAEAADAILTTDTRRKEIAVQLKAGGKTITIGGIAKGAGMIAPNMATLFCFITTDAEIPSSKLKAYLKGSVDKSFNMTVVDKDMSTNDCVFILANGAAGNRVLRGKDENDFKKALDHVCIYLAKEIARDGEGATKLIEVKVVGAVSADSAKLAAKAVAGSDLVKSAIFGEDPNFGRIMAALGSSGADIKQENVNVFIGGVQVVSRGKSVFFDQNLAKKHMKGKEVLINIMLGNGTSMATAWGCDLTYNYVKINAKYHT